MFHYNIGEKKEKRFLPGAAVCVGFLQVLQIPPISQDVHVRWVGACKPPSLRECKWGVSGPAMEAVRYMK